MKSPKEKIKDLELRLIRMGKVFNSLQQTEDLISKVPDEEKWVELMIIGMKVKQSRERAERSCAEMASRILNMREQEVIRETVVSYLHWDQERYWMVSPEQWEELYLLADGFGQIDLQFAKDQCWDWSHVRDSSPQAFLNMYRKILEWKSSGVLGKGNRQWASQEEGRE